MAAWSDEKPMDAKQLALQFLGGLICWIPTAIGIAAFTRLSFLSSYALLIISGLAFHLTALLWLTLSARRKDIRTVQFGIGSLLFLTVLVAIPLSLARYVVILIEASHGSFASPVDIVFVVGVIILLASFPFLMITHSLLWFSVWVIRRKVVQRWLALSLQYSVKDDEESRS